MRHARLPVLRPGLRSRVVAWSFVPTVIILSIVALFVYQTYQRVIESQVFERDRQLTALRGQQMAAQLRDLTDTLTLLAATPDVSRFDGGSLRITLDWSMDKLQVFDGGVLAISADGSTVIADRRRIDAESPAWPGKPALVALLQKHGQVTCSDIFDDGPAGPAVAIGVPVRGPDGQFQGLLAGILRVGSPDAASPAGAPASPPAGAANGVRRLLLRTPMGAPGTFYLIDGHGRILYHADPQMVGANVAGQPAVRQAMTGASGVLHTTGLSGQEILASYAPLPDTPWSLIQEEDWRALAASYQGYERTLVLLLLLALIVPSVVVAVGVRRITRPVADLTAAAERMAGGDLGRPIEVRTGDEIERLATQFNRMSEQIKDSYDRLEQRVDARTRELSTLNAISALISRSLDVEEILSTALEKTLEAMGLTAGLAYRLAADDESLLTLAACRGLPLADAAAIARIAPAASPAASGLAAAGTTPLISVTDTWPAGDLQAFCRRQGWQSVISLPLAAKGRLLGTMELGLAGERALAPEELALLAAIGQQTGVALENARLYREAEQSAVAAERNRLARELHDSVTQTLFAASIIAGVLPTLWQRNPEGGQRRLEELRMLTQGALAEMRTLLLELRPAKLTETPLGDLLQQLAAAVTMRARVAIGVDVKGQAPLPADVQIAFYRIAQEALNNMAKHAAAGHATITLRFGTSVVLTVADDGCGFDPAAVRGNHLGLGIMAERAAAIGAHLSVDSAPDCGTRVQVSWAGAGYRPKEDG